MALESIFVFFQYWWHWFTLYLTFTICLTFTLFYFCLRKKMKKSTILQKRIIFFFKFSRILIKVELSDTSVHLSSPTFHSSPPPRWFKNKVYCYIINCIQWVQVDILEIYAQIGGSLPKCCQLIQQKKIKSNLFGGGKLFKYIWREIWIPEYINQIHCLIK